MKSYKGNHRQVAPNILKLIQQNKKSYTGDVKTVQSVKKKIDLLVNEQMIGNATLKRISIDSYYSKEGLAHKQIYRLTIKGRLNTHYQYKKIRAFIFFPNGFPEIPPKIYFQQVKNSKGEWTRFQHINVEGSTGQLCQNINKKQQQYNKNFSLREILEQVQNTLYNVNVESAYPGILFQTYDTKYANGGKIYQNQLAKFSLLLEEDSDSGQDSDSD